MFSFFQFGYKQSNEAWINSVIKFLTFLTRKNPELHFLALVGIGGRVKQKEIQFGLYGEQFDSEEVVCGD